MALLTTQDNVYLSIMTPLGKDALILEKFTGVEGFSELFRFEAEVYAPALNTAADSAIDFTSLIQQIVTIQMTFDGKIRYISGIVTHLSQGPTVVVASGNNNQFYEKTYYYLTIQPTAWLMTLTENCLIFQNQTTMDIIKSVLAVHQIDILDQTTTAGTNVREYCVQYNESDFNFVSRLMEAEGIYYFFSHLNGTHTMVLCDSSKPYVANANYTTLPAIYYADRPSVDMPGLTNLRICQQIVPSAYVSKDYDFQKPSTNLAATALGQGDNRVIYHYPGNYILQPDGQALTNRRLGALEFPFASVQGDTNVPLLEIGTTLNLTNCPRQAANTEYVTYRLYHDALQENDENRNEQRSLYQNKVVLFDSTQIHLPVLKTPCPKVYGTQTALVMGKDGEEIWTDQYGRVLVKFYWDLSDTTADKTSCWIRVAQQWTGKNWGILFTPRIGQEVVVTFLDGNPDYPLITGCVYNGENLPPYLPDTPTKSTIKTNSSKGGNGFNELRFEDLANSEEIYMHAQKDLNIDVLNGNRTTTLEGQNGGGNDTLLLKKGNRAMTLDQGNESITLSQGNRSINVTGNQDVTVSGNYSMNIGGDLNIQVGGAISIQGSSTYSLQATGAATVQAQSYQLTSQTTATLQALMMSLQGDAQMSLQAPMIAQTANAAFTITSASVSVTADGMVSIVGQMLILG
ncbi:MAG: type VI secretion system tip protein TssI/VgrG [Alphaproteobacteria bacterium]